MFNKRLNKKILFALLISFFGRNHQVLARDLLAKVHLNYLEDNLSSIFFVNPQKKISFSQDQHNSILLSQDTLDNIEFDFPRKIQVVGNSIFDEEIEAIIQPYQDKPVDLNQLQAIAKEITQLYLNQGYITTRAIVSGVNLIEVQEGEIADIIVEGAKRLENYVKDRIALGAKTPLNATKLEEQLRLLKLDPLIENIEASLRKGENEKQSILAVRVIEADPFFGTVGIDNYSPPSIGDTQAIFRFGYGNVFGWGDSFRISYTPRWQSWTGTYNIDMFYQVPLNPMNGKLQARISLQENKVIRGVFKDFDISGESQFYELSYRQPVLSNPRKELAFSVGMSYRNGQTFTFQGPTPFGIGPNEDGISRTNVLSLGQDYVKRDKTGTWALQSQFRIGIGLFDVTKSVKKNDPDGYFFSWLGQVQRVQVLNSNNFLIIQAGLQLSDRPLLPSEQFVIGGGQSVRGYRQNVRAGDNGFRFSIEDRITVVKNEEFLPILQVVPFFDMGSVWNNVNNPNIQPDKTFIAALGLGLIWQPIKGLNLRLDYAPPLIDLVDRGNNIQDDGLYFNLKYDF